MIALLPWKHYDTINSIFVTEYLSLTASHHNLFLYKNQYYHSNNVIISIFLGQKSFEFFDIFT